MVKTGTLLKLIGQRIRLAREAKEITTKKIHEDTGISLSSINSIERGERSGKNWVKYVYYLKLQKVNLNKIFENLDSKE